MTFDEAVAHILRFEGGYVNDPADPGGETKYGISKRAYPQLDIKNLTVEDAKAIYYRDYWLPAGCDSLPTAAAFLVFDFAVNAGVERARRFWRDTQNVQGFTAERIRFYTKLTALFPTYGRGWMNRIAYGLDLLSQVPVALGRLRVVALHDFTEPPERVSYRTKVYQGPIVASITGDKLEVRKV